MLLYKYLINIQGWYSAKASLYTNKKKTKEIIKETNSFVEPVALYKLCYRFDFNTVAGSVMEVKGFVYCQKKFTGYLDFSLK